MFIQAYMFIIFSNISPIHTYSDYTFIQNARVVTYGRSLDQRELRFFFWHSSALLSLGTLEKAAMYSVFRLERREPVGLDGPFDTPT